MSCDIHVYPEVNRKGRWEFVYKCEGGDYGPTNYYSYSGRNYLLFGYLSGVRGADPIIEEPRGVPNDLSPAVQERYDADKEECHSFTWFTLKELLAVEWHKLENYDERGFPDMEKLLERLKTLSKNTKNVRLVFWFDN